MNNEITHFNNIQDCHIVINEIGTILQINDPYHCQCSNLLGLPIENVIFELNAIQLKHQLELIIQHKNQIKFHLIHRNSEHEYFEISITPIIEENIQTKFILIIHNITDKILIIQQFISKYYESQHHSLRKSAFLAQMSHEIRTPLNTIVGTSDLLQEFASTDIQKHLAQLFQKASYHLLSIVNEILELSKIEAGETKLTQEPFDIEEVLNNAAEIAYTGCVKKNVSLLVRVQPNFDGHVIGDSKHVRQIILNLLNNAVKFTNHGYIRLDLRTIQKNNETHLIQISVTDTGTGIPRSHKGKIFDEYRQVPGVQNPRFGSSGLGLAVCKRLVQQMNGSISFLTKEDRGTVFRIRIPLKSTSDYLSLKDAPLKEKTIMMCIEDSLERTILRSYLTFWGARIISPDCNSSNNFNLFYKQKSDLLIISCKNPLQAKSCIDKIAKFKPTGKNTLVIFPAPLAESNLREIRHFREIRFAFKPIRRSAILKFAMSATTFSLQDSTQDITPIVFTPNLSGKRILIVDDSEDNRYLFEAYLKGTHAKVDFAIDGQDGYEKFTQNDFDLVLMDIRMPRLNGFEAFHLFRQWQDQKKKSLTPIVAVTAQAFIEELKDIMAIGFNGHITKPIRKSDFLRLIEGYFVNPSSHLSKSQNY